MIFKFLRPKAMLAVFAITALLLGPWTNTIAWADNEAVSVQATASVLDVDSFAGLTGAIAAVNTNPGTEYILNIRNNILMTSGASAISNTAGVTIKSDMSLADAPFTITKGSSGFHFTVNGALTLEDIVLDGNWNGTSTSRYGGADVYGVFRLNDGAVIQNCNAGSSESSKGGGVSGNPGSTIIVDGGTIRNNRKTGTNGGGGVYVTGAGSSFTMIHGDISGNIATSPSTGYGGGVCATVSSAVTINGGTISGNTAHCNGGGVYTGNGVSFNMTGGTISGNNTLGMETSRGYGGGICISSSTALSVDISNSVISGNTAFDSYYNSAFGGDSSGGGIYVNITNSPETAALIISSSVIGGNNANKGGGVYSNVPITISDSEISGNTAASGHGGGIFGPASCYITVTGGRITGNRAPAGDGGGIYTADTSYSHLTSSGTTLYSGNRARAAYLFTGTPYPDIRSVSVSIPGTYVLNNYDVNYTGGALLRVYTVTYDANGGDGYYQDTHPALGSEYTVLSPDDTGITNPGYIFQGWNTAQDGSGTSYQPGSGLTIAGDITLYTQWLPAPVLSTHSVTYDANGGEGGYQDTDLAAGLEYTVLPLDNTGITNPGHAFRGWNAMPDGSGAYYPVGSMFTVSGDVALYAQWSVIGVGRVLRGTTRPPSYDQGWLTEIGETEVPLANTETTEIEENKIPTTGAISNSLLIGLSCLFILGGIICRPRGSEGK